MFYQIIILFSINPFLIYVKNESHRKRIDLQTLDYDGWCKFQRNEFICYRNKTRVTRWYYDVLSEQCKEFAYAHCGHSYNNFKTEENCIFSCRDAGLKPFRSNVTANVYCRLQPAFGDCYSYFPMFYFDIKERTCKGFSFSGCGGNQNKFETPEICMAACGTAVEYDDALEI